MANKAQSANGFRTVPRKNILAGLIIILAIPIIQLGFDVYFSVSFCTAAIALMVGGNSLVRNQRLLILSIPLFLGYGAKITSAILGSMENPELLVIFRELACYFVLLSIINLVEQFSEMWENTKPYLTLLFMAICIFGIVQAALLARGEFIGFPAQYFVINQGTLEGLEELIVNGYRFRATGFYGEPSYLSFVVMTLMTIVVYTYKSDSLRVKSFFGLLAISVSILAQSFSGVVAIGIWLCIWILGIWTRLSNIAKWFFPPIFILGAISLLVYFGEGISSRYGAVLKRDDESLNIRFDEPLVIIQSMDWNENLTGIVGMKDVQIDNGILSLYIRYGFISFLILGSMAMIAGDSLAVLYLFLALNFNGAVLAYDKVILFGLALGAMRHNQKKQVDKKSTITQILKPIPGI